jgi:hypothetical protein
MLRPDGPGRWGSNDINLGVKVSYANINKSKLLVEVAFAKEGYTPEVSYGTHFFQDLVEADIVIVLAHWGQEYVRHPIRPQRALASELLQVGADLVLGSHPHVVQDVQIVDEHGDEGGPRVVAYSLGNFAFDQGADDTAQGLALRLLFDADAVILDLNNHLTRMPLQNVRIFSVPPVGIAETALLMRFKKTC